MRRIGYSIVATALGFIEGLCMSHIAHGSIYALGVSIPLAAITGYTIASIVNDLD